MKTKTAIEGAKGKLSVLLQQPADPDRRLLVILMHGFMASKALQPLKGIANALEAEGISSLRFDFDGHGSSDGKFSDMTVLTELDDARRIFAYAETLGYERIAFVGHSQGGVVAGMLAGELGREKVAGLVQLAPAAVLRDDALQGVLMGKTYDPANPPEYLRVFFHKVGRGFFTVAQTLPIYETSARYEGPVCLIHGKDDTVVPYVYSERYHETYKDSSLHLLEGENHLLSKHRAEVIRTAVEFLKGIQA